MDVVLQNSALQQRAGGAGGSSGAAALSPAAGGKVDAKKDAAIHKVALEFEEVFMKSMLENMFKGLKTDGPFGGGSPEKNYRSMMVGEYAKSLTQSGGIGVADFVYRELLAIQEGQV